MKSQLRILPLKFKEDSHILNVLFCFNAMKASLGRSGEFKVVVTPEPAGGEAHFVWIRAPDAPIPNPTRHLSAHVDLPQAHPTHWQATMNDVFDI